ncbi:pyridoxamine 5'-phosphate oxidase family protein [Streptomyces sp. DSM 42041]|uniref:Pyridoxamine 5'-phosphate oxidase family protein n=1 Tax=Streptomyces hazeniae TaxID=3075538 RepID=A0ABU2NYR9_9ACTN|nr:pyridoxamine 5'-phosphate oxidase family protein [Streptomyces sp. DSM 42041]MDT0382137.1 pyridoxamine 5'-phosphate oxidase family protein [Streptomyces sp. DSM 42041]
MSEIAPASTSQATEPELKNLANRTRRLLSQARYLNLATVSSDGRPWVATLEYAWFSDPLRFVYGSAVSSQHSRDVAASPRVSGSLFLAGGSAGLDIEAVDGAQFSGMCAEISGADLGRYHAAFYEALFPDDQQRAQWMLPPPSLQAPADHRLYLIEVEQWWLIDTRTWEQDRIDRRVELP